MDGELGARPQAGHARRDRRALDRASCSSRSRPNIGWKVPLNLPPACAPRPSCKRHLTSLLRRTESCEDNLSFLGAGCWQHHVPAVVDEIVGR